MHQVSVDEPDTMQHCPASVKRNLTAPLGASDMVLNYYELQPGESFAYGFHAHESQEEVFYIIAGAVDFETESGTVSAARGEAIRFGPGEYQRGINHSDAHVVALALGAPQDSGGVDIQRDCPSCGSYTSQSFSMEDGDYVARCQECSTQTGAW